jgi:hypothetical protein
VLLRSKGRITSNFTLSLFFKVKFPTKQIFQNSQNLNVLPEIYWVYFLITSLWYHWLYCCTVRHVSCIRLCYSGSFMSKKFRNSYLDNFCTTWAIELSEFGTANIKKKKILCFIKYICYHTWNSQIHYTINSRISFAVHTYSKSSVQMFHRHKYYMTQWCPKNMNHSRLRF